MSRKELINNVYQGMKASGTKISKKTTDEVVRLVFSSIEESVVSKGRFSLKGFGTWTVRERQERMLTDIRTKQRITVPKSMYCAFKPSKNLRDTVRESAKLPPKKV